MTATVWHIYANSKEFVGPLNVLADGLIAPYEVALLPRGVEPIEADWSDPDELESEKGLLVGPGTTRGVFARVMHPLWVRVTSNPEIPVLGPKSVNPPGFVRFL